MFVKENELEHRLSLIELDKALVNLCRLDKDERPGLHFISEEEGLAHEALSKAQERWRAARNLYFGLD